MKSRLKKSTKTLRHVYHLYRRKKKSLSFTQNSELQAALNALQDAILKKDAEKAEALARKADALAKMHLKKNLFDHAVDLIFALGFALVVAVLVRTLWFEPYEIPTGSMRPTFKEQDRLIVSKTDFGINMPFTTRHFYFDPDLAKRMGIIIFTGEDMDIRDPDTVYFYLFPGKKQYIKRLIGKPGDILYFYGGEIFGIDKDGNDISSEFQAERFSLIDHIPFIRFEGNVATPPQAPSGIYSPVIFYQMNEPVAKMFLTSRNRIEGELLALPGCQTCEYSDLWGFKNYATARLLTKEQLWQFRKEKSQNLEEGVLYLELKHHPSFARAVIGSDEMGRIRPLLGVSTSVVPLSEEHLRILFSHMYTARFVVKNGLAMRYGTENRQTNNKNHYLPRLPDVPDGTYEFYHGKAYKVHLQGVSSELASDHPLYRFDPQRVQLFFNLGIEFDTRFSPQIKHQRLLPARYSYFRNGDLCLLGYPLLSQEDPTLVKFLQREIERQSAPNQNHYQAFVDAGPPVKEGVLDVELVKRFGLKIPSGMYLALGDNHAMSSDSRDFGFVPEGNLRGGPEWIFWPPGPRWGSPNQPPYPFISLSRLVVWGLVALSIGGWRVFYNKRNKLPLNFN